MSESLQPNSYLKLRESVIAELSRRGIDWHSLKAEQKQSSEQDWSQDPVGYVREVLHVEPWEKQRQILEAVRDHRRVAVRSCHHSGKTWCAAAIVHWFCRSFDPALVITTAPTDRQMRKLLWYEISRHQQGANLSGRLQQTELEASPTQRAYGFSTNTPERFQGWHSPNILVVVDEASGVPEQIYEAIEGVLTSENARLLLIGNPNYPLGTFYNAFRSPLYHTFHISAYDVPATLLPSGWKEERAQEWGEESPVYQVRVLGEFPDQAEDALIAMRWVTAAMEREIEPAGDCVLGVDIARYGTDESVCCVRRGSVVVRLETWRGSDTMATAGRVAALGREYGAQRIQVDEIGIGAGVLDRLQGDGLPAVGVNVGEAASDSEHYANKRAEIFFALQERFKTGDISLPDDSTLLAQLTSLKFVYTPQGKLKIESKEDMRKRGLPSPDRADALALAFCQQTGFSQPVSLVGAPRPSGGFRWKE